MNFVIALLMSVSCLTADIDNGQITETTGLTDGTIRTSIVGYYLWVQYGHKDDPDDVADDIVSWDISDPTITRAVICLDGTVTFSHEASEPETVERETTVDLVEEFSYVPSFLDRLDSVADRALLGKWF